MSLIRFAVIGTFLALSACARAEKAADKAAPPQEWPPRPTKEFLALRITDRNLAVYDAFAKAIESNYYDSKYFETDSWRTRRAAWREKAANAGEDALAIYKEVLQPMLLELPESHFSVQIPAHLADVPKDMNKLSPETWKRIRELAPLMHAGPGIVETTVRRGTRQFRVVSDVLPGGSAAKHGIQPGWRIIDSRVNMDTDTNAVHYNGEFVPLDAVGARAWERGELSDVAPPVGEVVHIEFDVQAYEMSAPAETRQLAGGVSYVRFNGFGDPDPMKPVHEAIEGAGAAGLILDLRWNSGGLRDQLEKVAAALFGEDVPMGKIQDRKGTSEMRTARNVRHFEGPLVVLIGPYSGSASEVLAAAVQDRKRGRLIGRMTNGSVLQSTYFALPDSGVVQIPVYSFSRIDGRRIEGTGVEPDVWILPTLEDVRAKRDSVLERALQEFRK